MLKNILLSSAAELTLADRRLFNYLLHHAIAELNKKRCFTIKFEALQGVYGVGWPEVERLQESLRRLMRTLIEFEIVPGNWVVIALLESAKIDLAAEQVVYSYSSYCSQIFTHPFSLERCLIQAHFQQKYSNLLYEILAHEFYQGDLTCSFEVADLRRRLHLPPSKLPNFGDFDRFALTPALNEINCYASFAVKFQTKRKGMKVTDVIFDMQAKRAITATDDAKSVIPPKRPRLFIDNPALERAYAFLLNAETKERRKYFTLASKHAAKAGHLLLEEYFDRPDLWFAWVEKELLKHTNN